MKIPDFLIDPISSKIFVDPVMIESGQTYERKLIENYFQNMKRQRDAEKLELSKEEFDEHSYFKCPVTYKRVDPTILIPNVGIKQAVADFIEQNPQMNEYVTVD